MTALEAVRQWLLQMLLLQQSLCFPFSLAAALCQQPRASSSAHPTTLKFAKTLSEGGGSQLWHVEVGSGQPRCNSSVHDSCSMLCRRRTDRAVEVSQASISDVRSPSRLSLAVAPLSQIAEVGIGVGHSAYAVP